MKTTSVVSITMPLSMRKMAEDLAQKENRTMSELMREALRRYNWERDFDRLNSYGRAKADLLGIKEKDIVPLIHAMRKEEAAKNKK